MCLDRTFARPNSRLKPTREDLQALPVALDKNRLHLWSQIEGFVVSGKQLRNAVDFVQEEKNLWLSTRTRRKQSRC